MLACPSRTRITLIPAKIQKKTDRVRLAIGGFDPDGAFVSDVTVLRSWGASGIAGYAPPQKILPGHHVFGGVLFDHFGHFLIDTLARVWAIKEHSSLRVAWICLPDFQGLKPWQKDIFDLLGIDQARFEYVQIPSEFEQLSLPEPGFICSGWADAECVEALASVPFKSPIMGKKLWLSRTALPLSDGGIDNEAELETILAKEGWTVVMPEKVAVADLLSEMSDAEAVGGLAGSAFHLLMLAVNPKTKVVIVQREDVINNNYYIIQKIKRLSQQIVYCARSKLTVRGGAKGRFHIDDVKAVASDICAKVDMPLTASDWDVDPAYAMKSPDFFARKFAPVWRRELDVTGVRASHYKEIPRTDVHSLFQFPPRKVLDVGCATGAAGVAIKRSFPGAYVCGVELNPDSVRLAQSRLDKVFVKALGELDHLELAEIGEFDTILYLDVLEHMYNPWAELQFLRQCIKSDAQLIVSLPNIGNIDAIQGLLGGRWRYRGAGVMDITHMRFFCEQDMVRLFYQAGFRLLEKKYLKTGQKLVKPPAFPHTLELAGGHVVIRDEIHFNQLASPQIAFCLSPAKDTDLTTDELNLKYSDG
jgi:capsular polysaccharide biosynthesis protein/2-polyprenyl-3-methyl-5-hydroxy-6-metoxy-1,4-benzoquinol methylase